VKQRALGTATVSAIGCGDVSLPIAAARGIDARDLARAIDRSLELGITLIECASDADTERLVGDAIRAHRLRDTVTLATHAAGGDLRARVEASLRATRLDVLPLVQLTYPLPRIGDLHTQLVREGKVLQWGVRADAPPEPRAPSPPPASLIVAPWDPVPEPAPPKVAFEPWLISLAVPFSLCDRRAEPLLDGPPALLARHPLAGGALAGVLGPGMKLALRDDRNALAADTLERISIALARLAPHVRDVPAAARTSAAASAILETTRRTRDPEATTIAELALRYVIDRGAIALPRLHREEHVGEAISAASAAPLSPDLIGQLNELSV